MKHIALLALLVGMTAFGAFVVACADSKTPSNPLDPSGSSMPAGMDMSSASAMPSGHTMPK